MRDYKSNTVADHTPNDILRNINTFTFNPKEYTYVIVGISGPTGKTWLCEQLKERGYKAIELSESLNFYVRYSDKKNHVSVDGENKIVLITLNQKLKHERLIRGTTFINPMSTNIFDVKKAKETMIEAIITYGCVTIADLHDLMGVKSDYTSNNYGWYHLHGVEIKEDNGMFYLDLPEPRYLP